MATSLRWTSADVALLPDDGKRYEIIDGELYVSKQPTWHHQQTCLRIGAILQAWSDDSGSGEAGQAPGMVFADDDDVAPDVVWIGKERLKTALDGSGHLRVAPELVVEVLSPGVKNERRDREAKLQLYSRRGVREYWIADWQQRTLEIYRREDAALRLVDTLHAEDVLESPLLPKFSTLVERLFGPR